MPIYEYQCTTCGEQLEVIQNRSDPPHSVCPKCGGEMKKLLSAPGIHFKGSGWYKTDYASKSSKPETTDTKSETKTESTKTESPKSDSTKPE